MVDLKMVRLEKGLTQEQLSKAVGIGRTAISNIECGLSRPSVETAKALAKVLEFDWTSFFEDGDGNEMGSFGQNSRNSKRSTSQTGV